MTVFTFNKSDFKAVIVAHNRGHAVKMLAKELEKRGMTLTKEDPVTPLDLENEKGQVLILE